MADLTELDREIHIDVVTGTPRRPYEALESRRPAPPTPETRRRCRYEACSRRRAREARRLMRLPQTEVLHHTRAWFFELS